LEGFNDSEVIFVGSSPDSLFLEDFILSFRLELNPNFAVFSKFEFDLAFELFEIVGFLIDLAVFLLLVNVDFILVSSFSFSDLVFLLIE